MKSFAVEEDRVTERQIEEAKRALFPDESRQREHSRAEGALSDGNPAVLPLVSHVGRPGANLEDGKQPQPHHRRRGHLEVRSHIAADDAQIRRRAEDGSHGV